MPTRIHKDVPVNHTVRAYQDQYGGWIYATKRGMAIAFQEDEETWQAYEFVNGKDGKPLAMGSSLDSVIAQTYHG